MIELLFYCATYIFNLVSNHGCRSTPSPPQLVINQKYIKGEENFPHLGELYFQVIDLTSTDIIFRTDVVTQTSQATRKTEKCHGVLDGSISNEDSGHFILKKKGE
jgi:hypothetical protein